MKLYDACDYIITKVCEAGEGLNALKLQKLLYYTQAWHLAFTGKPLFAGKFQAWVHGPVSREIYDRFLGRKSLYSDVTTDDVRGDFDLDGIPELDRDHIDNVLEAYAKYTGTQLEEMTHAELPWQKAREGFRPSQRCEQEIDERLMQTFYASKLRG